MIVKLVSFDILKLIEEKKKELDDRLRKDKRMRQSFYLGFLISIACLVVFLLFGSFSWSVFALISFCLVLLAFELRKFLCFSEREELLSFLRMYNSDTYHRYLMAFDVNDENIEAQSDLMKKGYKIANVFYYLNCSSHNILRFTVNTVNNVVELKYQDDFNVVGKISIEVKPFERTDINYILLDLKNCCVYYPYGKKIDNVININF